MRVHRPTYSILVLLASTFVAAGQSVTLTGTVVNEDGPVGSAIVEVLRNDGTRPRTVLYTCETGENGTYRFEFGRVGLFLIRVQTGASSGGTMREVSFFADKPGVFEADLVLDTRSSQNKIEVHYADEQSTAARTSAFLARSNTNPDVHSISSDLGEVFLIRSLYDSFMHGPAYHKADLAAEALTRIPPSSPLWLATGDLYLILRTIDATGNPDLYADYAEEYVLGQSDPYAVAGSVFELMGRSRLVSDTSRVRRYLDFLDKRAPDSNWTARARTEFSDDRAFKPGLPVPAFKFPKLRADGFINPDDVRQTVFLLDFWAVWCGPCVAERGELKTLYDAYSEDGFDIVSVSFDFDPEAVDLERWPMPWKHGYLDPNAEYTEQVKEIFALGALPKLILVDRDGRLLIGGAEVRPEHVRESLARLFGH